MSWLLVHLMSARQLVFLCSYRTMSFPICLCRDLSLQSSLVFVSLVLTLLPWNCHSIFLCTVYSYSVKQEASTGLVLERWITYEHPGGWTTSIMTCLADRRKEKKKNLFNFLLGSIRKWKERNQTMGLYWLCQDHSHSTVSKRMK